MCAETLRYPQEPSRFNLHVWDEILLWAAREQGASDITVQTERAVWVDIKGQLYPVTQRSLDKPEVEELLNAIWGANGSAEIARGRDLDMSYEVQVPGHRHQRVRFRVNATGVLADGRDGIQVTLRVLPEKPPRLEDLDIEPGLREALFPANGMVVITGPTGSGKTTLLGAVIRSKVEAPENHRKVLTYEAPIELVYDEVVGPHSFVSQSEIPWHLPDFAAGARNALRRKPTDILVGECRDPETIKASAEAANTGHVLYTTSHANGVAETISRMLSVFGPEERPTRAAEIGDNLKLVCTQLLVPDVNGGRVAAREYLVFDEEVRGALFDAEPKDWSAVVRTKLASHGRAITDAVADLYAEGRISATTRDHIADRRRLKG